MNDEAQKLSEEYRARIQSVDPATCSDLFRCPHCASVLEKPEDMYEPGAIDELERRSCIPDAFGIQPVLFNCYCCGEEIGKVTVFEGTHDIFRSELSRKERGVLDMQEEFCINCKRRRHLEWGGRGFCFGNKLHVFHRKKPGIRIGDSSLYESVRMRLQSGWIPNRWNTHYDLVQSIYFRNPDSWYPSSAYGTDVCYLADDRSSGLAVKLLSCERINSADGMSEYAANLKKSIREDQEVEAESEKHIQLAAANDPIWPQFERERPQFSIAGLKRSKSCRWLRFRYSAPSPLIEEVYVLENESHIVSAHFRYPDRSASALKPVLRRMVRTIRLGAR